MRDLRIVLFNVGGGGVKGAARLLRLMRVEEAARLEREGTGQG